MDSLNKLCLGTAQFGSTLYGVSNNGKKVSDVAIKSILDCCFDNRIATIDTAYAYGDSQSRIGQHKLHDWEIISKIPSLSDTPRQFLRKKIISFLKQSLRDLNVKSLDTLMVHDSKDISSDYAEDVYLVLAQLKEEGLIKKIGVSIYSPDDYYSIPSSFGIDVVQAPWNVFDQSLSTSGLLSHLNNLGISIHIRSIFLQGLLLMNQNDRPKYFQSWSSALNLWDNYCRDLKATKLEVCLRASLTLPNVDRVLFGVEDLSQLRQIIASAKSEKSYSINMLSQTDKSLINPKLWSI